MKLSILRACATLGLALGLAACGSGKAEFSLGGPVTGLQYSGLVLTNTKNGDSVTVDKPLVSGADVTFTLPRTVEYGDEYAVVVTTPPEHQSCTVFGGADTAGRLASPVINVRCTVDTFAIGGTVTGLRATADATSTGLVIANGNKQRAIEVDGAYTFPEPVAYGDSYSVSILKQPTEVAGSANITTCVVENPVGEVLSTKSGETVLNPVNNINIKCTTGPRPT